MSVSSPTILAERFGVTEVREQVTEANYNVAPRTEVPAIAESRGERVLDVLRWGLVPSWAKDTSIGDRQINARAETVATANAYKRAFARRRCIIPADGFYEWEKVPDPSGAKSKRRKQPWFFRRRDGEPLAFAGLWEVWHDPALGDDAPRIRTCVIITTDANGIVRPVHDRMPVVLPETAWDAWLSRDNDDVTALAQLLVPSPDDELECWAVGMLVNKADNNGPELLDRAQDLQGDLFRTTS